MKLVEKVSNFVSHECGYCNKIFEDEHGLDEHIEEIHFLEVLDEDKEDGEDDAMESVDVGINEEKVTKTFEGYKGMDNLDININEENMNKVSEEYEVVDTFDFNVQKKNSPESSELDPHEQPKPKKIQKQKKANKQNGFVSVNIRSDKTDEIANAEQKKLRKREKERLKKQRQRQRQLELGILKEKKPRKQLFLGPKEPSIRPHRDWSPFYRQEGDTLMCLGCLAEFGALYQVHRHLSTSSVCGIGVGLKTEAMDSKKSSLVSHAPSRNYQGLYLKGDNTWICTKCGHNFRSSHGVHAHLKVTICGFGTQKPKPQRINYQSMYRKTGEEYECIKCGAPYKSQHGVHHHLKSTLCGFGTDEAKTKQNTSFKSLYRKEGKVCLCNACGAEYKSSRGVYHHLKTTNCGFPTKDTKSEKKLETLSDTSNVGSAIFCNFCSVGFMSIEGLQNHLKMTNCIQLNTAGQREKGEDETS